VANPLAGRPLHGASLRWPAASRRGSVVLPLPPPHFRDLPPRLSFEGRTLTRKDEFHLTLFDAEEWRMVRAVHREPVVAAAAESLDWRISVDGACWLVRRPDAPDWCTLIASLHAPAMARLRDTLRTIACPLPPPTPHVTLYCSDARGGIGVSGPAQWEARVVAALEVDWQACVAGRMPGGAAQASPPAGR
jgi:hypothetical protein